MLQIEEKIKEKARAYNQLNSTLKGEVTWQCPSNIALVKYWGKRDIQIPMNPSISFTLNECVTQTKAIFELGEKTPGMKFYFNGKHRPDFEKRIQTYLNSLDVYFPFLNQIFLELHSSNSFPHSSGIASSASGMGALALVLCSIESQLNNSLSNKSTFLEKASFIARLGSGSACRSIYPKLVLWGEHENITNSSNEVAIPMEDSLNDIYKDFLDIILLIDEGKKSVSSSVGHQLMNGHPYAHKRFDEANKNIERMVSVLESGDLEAFVELVEHEALSLHAMMMTSSPSFILMKSSTLIAIEKIRNFRHETGIMACFTLDAGANIHLLAPGNYRNEVISFVNTELKSLCQSGKYIVDKLGEGPIQLESK